MTTPSAYPVWLERRTAEAERDDTLVNARLMVGREASHHHWTAPDRAEVKRPTAREQCRPCT